MDRKDLREIIKEVMLSEADAGRTAMDIVPKVIRSSDKFIETYLSKIDKSLNPDEVYRYIVNELTNYYDGEYRRMNKKLR